MGRSPKNAKRPAVEAGLRAPGRKAIPPAARAALLQPRTSGTIVIRWTSFDYEGPFCLGKSDAATIVDVLMKLRNFESLTIRELFRPGSEHGKTYAVAEVPNPLVMERLTALGMADETEISRLRLTGTQRLYGFVKESEFYPVFWDPKHEIWPSTKKHT